MTIDAMLAAVPDPDIVKAALQLGAWGYALKSDAAQDLVEAIHAVARG